jgi:biotin transporter BioY
MNSTVKSEKYRKLSTAALVTGILGLSPILLYNFLWMPISIFLSKFVESNIIPYIILPFIVAALGLSIAAVVCGSIDLNRIKKRFETSHLGAATSDIYHNLSITEKDDRLIKIGA